MVCVRVISIIDQVEDIATQADRLSSEKISIPGPSGTDFLLTGWAFTFVSDENEIRDIGVLRSGDDVTVFYGDKDADDLFDWRVEWAHVGRQVLAPPNV